MYSLGARYYIVQGATDRIALGGHFRTTCVHHSADVEWGKSGPRLLVLALSFALLSITVCWQAIKLSENLVLIEGHAAQISVTYCQT